MDGQNPQVSSNRTAQIQQEKSGGSDVVVVGDKDEQNWLSQSFSSGPARFLEKSTDVSASEANAGAGGQNPQVSSSRTAQIQQQTMGGFGVTSVEDRDEQNWLSQSLSNDLARVFEKAAHLSGAALNTGAGGRNPQVSSSRAAQIQQQTMGGSGVMSVEDRDEQNWLSQSLSNDLARVFEKAAHLSGAAPNAGIDGQNPQVSSNRTAQIQQQTLGDSGPAAAEKVDGQNWFSSSFAQVLEKAADLAGFEAEAAINGKNPGIASDGVAQTQQETRGGTGSGAAEDEVVQNWLAQSFSTGLARTIEKAAGFPGSAANPGIDAPDSQASPNGIAQASEKSAGTPGTPTVAEGDEQNPFLQLLSNGIIRFVERDTDSFAAPAVKGNVSDSGTRSQPAPQQTFPLVSSQPEPILGGSETHNLFSKPVAVASPAQSGNPRNIPGTADVRPVPGESAGSPGSQNSDAAALQNEPEVRPRIDPQSGPNDSGNVSLAQDKANAGQPDFPWAKTGTNVDRQDVLFHNVSTAAPMVDAHVRTASSLAPETAQPQNLVLQIAERIQIQVRDGGGEIRIQLKPDGLGQLSIKAETTANGVIARIITDSDGVKSYLENNLHQLQQALQDQGLKVDRIYVTVQNGSDHQPWSSHTTQFSHGGTRQQGREPQNPQYGARIDESDVSEEIAVDPETWLMLKPNTRFYTVA
jgi:hypothetical protein